MGGQPSKERTRRLANNKNDQDSFVAGQNSVWNTQTFTDQFGPACPAVDQFVLALYDYNPSNSQESQSQICVEKDDRLRLFGYSADGDWADVECMRTGERGWVPANYTSPLSPPAPSALANRNSSITFQQGNSRGTSGHGSQASLAGVGLDTEKWYHGAIQRSYAEYLLNSGITGSFLVRESESKPGQLTISLRFEGRIFHYRINRDDNGMFSVTETTKFNTVAELINHHGKHADGLACTLLYPAAKRDKLCTEVSPEVDVWEIDRTEIIMKHKLGSGQYGVVYEALWKPYNLLVAVKTLKEDVTVRDEFLEEARVMKSLRHPNLVELLGACTQEPPYYIVTEFMCNGNLLDYLRCRPRDELSPPVLLHMALQVARGMAYLEQHNFIHRDLAARNCLVGKEQTIKVADFGLARCMERDLTYQAHEGAKFPIKWTAPEGLVYNLFSTKSDVWAFGVLLWEIATYGKTPYPGIELQDVYVLLEKGTRMNQPEGCPEPVYQLMLQCWQWLPEQRPTFSVLLGQLEAMHKSATIEEQVAVELARGKHAGKSSNAHSKSPVIPKSAIHCKASVPNSLIHPPLPPRPPPPRRSTSFDRLLEERHQIALNGRSGSPASDEGQLDSGVGGSSSWVSSGRSIQQSYNTQSSGFSEAMSERILPPANATGSLGRKRTAPRPPRRTTPVKPIIFGSDQFLGDELTQDELPPCPLTGFSSENVTEVFPPPPIDLESSGISAFSHQNSQKPTPTSNPSTIPTLMTTSAIYPVTKLDSPTAKPSRPSCLSYLSCMTRPRFVVQPTKYSGSKNTISETSSSSETNRTHSERRHVSESATAGKTCTSADSNAFRISPVDAKQTQLRRTKTTPVPPADFHDELRQRLLLQSQSQTQDSGQTPRSNKPCPSKSPTKPPLGNKNDEVKPDSSNSGFFTMPRLRPAQKLSRTNTDAQHPARNGVHTPGSSHDVLPKTSHESVRSSLETQSPGILKPVLRTPKASYPSTTAKSNQKRLSWTGPAIRQFPEPSHSHKFRLPTIQSTSSTALDSVDDNESSGIPTRTSLLTLLMNVSNSLARLKSSLSHPISTSSDVEQFITVADQLEACRLQCSEFIDHANCAARTKFSFRDRYAPLQQLSTVLRSKKSDSERSSALQLAISAVDDLSAELLKIPELGSEEQLNCPKLPASEPKSTDSVPTVMTSV